MTMKSKLFVILSLLVILVFGSLTIYLIKEPFGIFFTSSFYILILGLLCFLSTICYRLIKANKLIAKLSGLLIGVIVVLLLLSTIIITYDYRIFYFKSPAPKPTKYELQEDLNYLSAQMRSIHPNLYSMVSKTKLDSLQGEIYNRIPNNNDSDILMDLFRFTALPNDAHTFPFIFFPCYNLHNLPIQVYGFEDGWYIVEAGRAYKKLIGTKILKIGSKDIEDIFETCPILLGAENNQSKLERFTYMIVIPEWLKYYGIIDSIDKVELTLSNSNNHIFKKRLPTYKYFPPFIWSNVSKIANNKPHVYTNPREDWYQFTPIKDNSVLYIEYHQCDDQPGKETVAEFAKNLENHINEYNYERYIIDLRSNDGGNSNVNRELIRVISNSGEINQYGKLYVLIGRRTFSAAVMFANQLQMQANPIFVGEATSQGPIFYGQPNLIELPNSKLVFGISSHRTISGLPFDDRNIIEPDLPINFTINDFLSGKDPVLNAALNYKEYKQSIPSNIENVENILGNYIIGTKDFAKIFRIDEKLYLEITDYVPNSLIRFNSILSKEKGNKYFTKIENFFIEVYSYGNTDEINLMYMGNRIHLDKILEQNQLAMKFLSDGKIDLGLDAIMSEPQYYINTYKDLEQILNSLGYQLMGDNRLDEAILVFESNSSLFPESSNVYDSLAESYMNNDKYELAIEYYNKSLKLNPNNKNALKMIERIKKKDKL